MLILSILTGIISSLIASLVFLYFTFRLKPNILRHPLINCKVQLELVKEEKGFSEDKLPELETIKMDYNSKMFIEKNAKGSKYNRVTFRTFEDLDSIWSDDNNSYLRFRISANHELSGLGKVFTQCYDLKKESIKEGTFEFGNSFRIIPI